MDNVTNLADYKRQSEFEAWALERSQQGLQTPAYCDPSNEFKGENFDRNLDVKEIAKRVRKGLKNLTGFNFSVRISRFSGGQSIDVELKSIPNDVALYSPEYIAAVQASEDRYPRGVERYSEIVTATLKYAGTLLRSYNRDNSDSQSDYFDVHFYDHTTISSDLINQREFERIKPKPRVKIRNGQQI